MDYGNLNENVFGWPFFIVQLNENKIDLCNRS